MKLKFDVFDDEYQLIKRDVPAEQLLDYPYFKIQGMSMKHFLMSKNWVIDNFINNANEIDFEIINDNLYVRCPRCGCKHPVLLGCISEEIDTFCSLCRGIPIEMKTIPLMFDTDKQKNVSAYDIEEPFSNIRYSGTEISLNVESKKQLIALIENADFNNEFALWEFTCDKCGVEISDRNYHCDENGKFLCWECKSEEEEIIENPRKRKENEFMLADSKEEMERILPGYVMTYIEDSEGYYTFVVAYNDENGLHIFDWSD